MPPKATMERFFDKSIPKMLQHITLHYSFPVVLREEENQRQRICNGHIHRDLLNSARELLQDPHQNLAETKSTDSVGKCITTW